MKYDAAVIGSLGGTDVVVTPMLPETVIHHFPEARKIVCGNVAHLRYEITKAQVRIDIRADLERQLDAFAGRVGVDRLTRSE